MRFFSLLAFLLAAPIALAQNADQWPQVVGGIDSIAEQLRYPALAKQAGIEGRIFARHTVDEAGAVQNAVVVRGIEGGELDEEALRVTRGLTFEPALKDDQPVEVTLPITFRLPDDDHG